MDIEWRTVQLFIEDEYEDGLKIAEVEMDFKTSRKLRCSCKEFNTFARCKHQKWVKSSIEENDGHYKIYIPAFIDDKDAVTAMSTQEGFRDFVLKYGKVEVI